MAPRQSFFINFLDFLFVYMLFFLSKQSDWLQKKELNFGIQNSFFSKSNSSVPNFLILGFPFLVGLNQRYVWAYLIGLKNLTQNEYQKYCRIIEYPRVSRIYKFSLYKQFYVSNLPFASLLCKLKVFVLLTSKEQERKTSSFPVKKRESKKVSENATFFIGHTNERRSSG
jgi:hypothetical protein